MRREQFLLDSLNGLFREPSCSVMRRKTDVAPARTDLATDTPNRAFIPRRWVQRDGRTVRVRLVLGPFGGRLHVFYLPTESVALEFAVALLKTDVDGYPASVDPEEWAVWQRETL